MLSSNLIFTYWDQGWERVPAVVELCRLSLELHHPDATVHFLDSESVQDWIEFPLIDEEKWTQLPLPHRSDLIRTALLIKYGGVWVDPTVWFSRPMTQWLEKRSDAGLFLFSNPGRDRIIANWFIASSKENPIMCKLYSELIEYWNVNDFKSIGHNDRRAIGLLSRILNRNNTLPQIWFRNSVIRLFNHAPYLVYHYMFARIVASDGALYKAFSSMPKVSADGPHTLLRLGLNNPASLDIDKLIDRSEIPLFKLNWRTSNRVPDDSVLMKLQERTQQLTSTFHHIKGTT